MGRIWPGLALLLAWDAALMAADGPSRGVRRYKADAVFVPGIPARDYRYHRYSPHAVAVSEAALPLGLAGEAPDPAVRGIGLAYGPGPVPFGKVLPLTGSGLAGEPRRAKLYQFLGAPALRIDHCVVSGMAMALTEDGDYVLSFRAEQNPRFVADSLAGPAFNPEPAVTPEVITPSVRQTSQILRNRFFVIVRGYAARSTPEPLGAPAVASPAVMQVEFPGFWVERGQPLPARLSGRLPAEQARYFDVIDRIEFEFYYEYQSGLVAGLP